VDIAISIDGATKETFEEIRTGSNFDLVLEKLAMIRKLRDLHVSEFFSRFSFNFVALRRNIDELPDVVRLAHRFGIGHVHVADYAPNENEFDEESLRHEPTRANAALDEARAVAAELGVHLSTPMPYEETAAKSSRAKRRPLFSARDRFAQKCNSPWREPYIHTDGRVSPCCASGQYLGNLNERSFAQIWNGWRYRLLRWRVHSPIPRHECRVCFVAWGINGGNAANAMAKEGLLVRAWYAGEARFKRFAKRVLAILRRARGGKAAPGPEPNFYRGRPITERNRPAEPGR
jgi:radical SAM protein with 4Fe4S-binding SPASM domain